jgi:hypothetical protein
MLSRKITPRRSSIFAHLAALALAGFSSIAAQTPSPSPEPEVTLGDYRVTAVTEVGFRWRSVDGNFNKYRSDLNYKQGFRSFDSSFLLQAPEGKGTYFDSLLISNTGWGSDPQGSTRVNMEKLGAYKFTSNVRRVTYFNNLFNFANPINLPDSEHSQNTKHTFGDFDLTALPQNEKLRLTFGVSFNKLNGTGGTTERFFSDEFAVNSRLRANSIDFRVGAEGKVLGFDWGVLQGYRNFHDRPFYFLTAPSQGNTTTNQSRLDTFQKNAPMEGTAYYTIFNVHRLFADRLDFTARAIYSSTSSDSMTQLLMTGRDNTNPVGILVRSDQIDITANAKRPQTRADVGLTYLAGDNFRISNTFSFDQFAVNGFETFREAWVKANGATSVVNSIGYRVNAYKRYTNTIEGDYQFNNRIAAHLGYRYTHRMVKNSGFDFSSSCVQPTTPPVLPCPPNPPRITNTLIDETEKNTTNTVIAGMKIKPTKYWVIFWDVEHGEADNVFTRLENYNFTNFRFRNRLTFNKVTFNLSALSKDNENPSDPQAGVIVPANVSFITNIKNRFYTGSLDWEALANLWISSGYTYRHLTSYTPIVVPISGAPGTYVPGFSQFFIRDHYAFFDVTTKPVRRVSLYASYRISRDRGQGSRISAPVASIANPNIIGSYPMRFATPEFRAAIRLTRNVDWNLGYQYYNYKDTLTPVQNYRAHLPYTSLRIYFGQGSDDR